MKPTFPLGKCGCGCNGDTNINPKTKQPYRYLRGHGTRAVTLPDGRRWCKYCDTAKPLEDFIQRRTDRPWSKNVDGRDNRCKSCYAEKQRSYREARKSHYQRSERNRALKRKYGITLEQYQQILAEQGGGCAICGRTENLVVDHCHDRGHVRGIICKACNTGLGQFGDNALRVFAASKYLQRKASI